MSLILAALTLLACGTDLPEGWEDAVPVEDFAQSACEGSSTATGVPEAMTASAGEPGIRVVGDPVHFRCEQEVEAFYRTSDGVVDVLVQPVDMNPSNVARCDCMYRVEAGVPQEPPAEVRLYRRWDNINDPNDPVLIGTVAVP